MAQQLNELFGMAGKVVLVTGASSGLGEHFARVMASAGATVVVAARRVERIEALVTELEKGGANTEPGALHDPNPDTLQLKVAAAPGEML